MVGALGAFLLLSGVPVLEQGVDVERSWFLDDNSTYGLGRAAVAVACIGLLTIALRYLASVHAAPVPNLPAEPDRPYRKRAWEELKDLLPWLLTAGALLLLLLVADWTSFVNVSWTSARWIPIVVGAVPLVSAALALNTISKPIKVCQDDVRNTAYRLGRALAWCVPIVLMASICRSLVAPILVLNVNHTESIVVFFIAAILAIVFAGVVFKLDQTELRTPARKDARLLRSVDPQLVGQAKRDASDDPGTFVSMFPSGLVTVLCAVPLLVFPIHTSEFLGVVGTVAICLLAITALYATVQILAQNTVPPLIFRAFGLRRTPVVSIALLIVLLSARFSSDTSLHNIRGPEANAGSGQPIADRPDVHAAFATWLARQADECSFEIGQVSTSTGAGQPVKVQPLLLVASEGGGIRAAWWTVDVMTALTSTSCGRNAVFLASGVSGGAVGLAMVASNQDAYSKMEDVADEDAVAAAMDGLLARDLLAGTVGVNIRATDGPEGDDFPDRAALMEQTFEREMPGLSAAFPGTDEVSRVPWHTVFNGTSVANKCRLLISDVRLTDAATCDESRNPIPGAYDLFTAERCDTGLATSTASLLVARFPYVTPSGIVTTCKDHAFDDQIIDGGYSENSGLDTLNGALGQLMPDIRLHNETALEDGEPLVVPLVVFLHNTVVTGDVNTTKTPVHKAEALVPPLNRSDTSFLGKPSTLLQGSATIAGQWVPDGMGSPDATVLRESVRAGLGTHTQTMTVAPQRSPALALPLGWALSHGTEAALDAGLDAYLWCEPLDEETCPQRFAFNSLLQGWGTTMSFPAPK